MAADQSTERDRMIHGITKPHLACSLSMGEQRSGRTQDKLSPRPGDKDLAIGGRDFFVGNDLRMMNGERKNKV